MRYLPPFRRHRKIVSLLVLAAGLTPLYSGQAERSSAVPSRPTQLNILVKDDHITLSITRVPQIYLYGPIDDGAPERFKALMRTGRIKPGSDVYLNSSSGNLNAGLALGRLFRQGSMATHLGIPRLPRPTSHAERAARCEGACAYAYLGGLYRWAISGSDRLGFPTYRAQQMPAQIDAYLHDMGIDPTAFTIAFPASSTSSTASTLWPSGDEMIATGLANNGRQNLIGTFQYVQGVPYLELKQNDRNGAHKIRFLCKSDGVELTTYDTMGAKRAQQIVAREQRSYFEINQQETLSQQASATTDGESVVLHRIFPLNRLPQLASAQAMGAWVRDRTGIRYGFAFEVSGVKKVLNHFYNACVQTIHEPS